MIEEAQLEQTTSGLAPAGAGWFVVNVRDAAWYANDAYGRECHFESDAAKFGDLGVTVVILQPGQSNGMYHREGCQEDFLVVSGECVVLIEEQERRLRAWDFVHCPPETDHIFVGAGDGPCVLFMTGARKDNSILYPSSDFARSRGVGVATETPSAKQAYAASPPWRAERPVGWDGLPWA